MIFTYLRWQYELNNEKNKFFGYQDHLGTDTALRTFPSSQVFSFFSEQQNCFKSSIIFLLFRSTVGKLLWCHLKSCSFGSSKKDHQIIQAFDLDFECLPLQLLSKSWLGMKRRFVLSCFVMRYYIARCFVLRYFVSRYFVQALFSPTIILSCAIMSHAILSGAVL